MRVSLLVAASENNAIGKHKQLPWHLPNDMRFFKNTTWGMPVLMGRRTFESMKSEPLPGRSNIVITHRRKWKPQGIAVVNNFKDALLVANDTDTNEIFVIGGGEIFKEVFDKADRIYMTRVHTVVDGDVFFPEIDTKKWKKVSSNDCFADDKHAYDYTFETWNRK